MFAKERTQNGNTYTMKSNMGLLNIVATGYSQIIITAPDGQETMIYDVSKAQKSGTVLEITFAMLFVGAVVYGLTREFSKAKSAQITVSFCRLKIPIALKHFRAEIIKIYARRTNNI